MGLRSFIHRMTAPRANGHAAVHGSMKLVCVVHQSLKMGKGKIAAQVGHASVESFLRAGTTHPAHLDAWLSGGQKKICLKAKDETVFAELKQAADKEQIPCHIVRDAGHTQIPSGSQTVLALGPYGEEHLDNITGHLKLL